jgi:hypothetical protein
MTQGIGWHGYCSFPKSIKHCCTAFACTATPANISDKTEHATNRAELFPAQKGQGRTPANKVCRVPPSAVPSFYFEPYHYSCDATSCLSFLSYHLCTATVPQQQQSTGIMFRLYQRISVIFPDNVEVLFPGSNPLRKDPGSSRPFWYRQAVSPVDGE